MEIRVIIVDDDKNNAKRVLKAVESFKSMYQHLQVEYKIVEPFTTIHAFSNARDYIISSQKNVDVLLVDYHLIRGLGTDLFSLVKSELKIYKILHSETRDSIMESKNKLSRNQYNDFCYSKEPETIHEVLKIYETEILSIKLFGNPLFRDKYFINLERLFENASKIVHNNILAIDIVYILSEGDDLYMVYYRDKETGRISSFKERKFKVSGLISDLYFRKVSNKVIINLLWIAEINTSSRKISFITLVNELHTINYSDREAFNVQIAPNMQKIKQGIPNFFCD